MAVADDGTCACFTPPPVDEKQTQVDDEKRGMLKSPRVRNPELLRQLRRRWQECVLCFGTAASEGRLSLHHIHRHPRNDVEGNLVMLCGDGTTGCHGRVEARDAVVLSLLGQYLIDERPDTIAYLYGHLGRDEAEAWLRRHLKVLS